MYKIEIDISEWDWGKDKVVIETSDFDKITIFQEFIEFQKDHAWCVDYDVTEEFSSMQCDEEVAEIEEEEEEEYEIGDWYYAEDGTVWERIE
jgi:hypothetical protein